MLLTKDCNPDFEFKLSKEEVLKYFEELSLEWTIHGEFLCLQKKFKDFKAAFELTKQIGELSEKQWHHPTIKLSFGFLEIRISTHSISAISLNDFILASKIEQLILNCPK